MMSESLLPWCVLVHPVVHDILAVVLRRCRTLGDLATWLHTPRRADGRTPAELMAAGEFNRARLLAHSVPSPRLVRPPAWVDQPVFRAGAEHRQEPVLPEDD